MLKFLYWATAGLLIIVAVLDTVIYLYFQRPLFGALPDSSQIKQFEHTAHYHDGQFINQILPLHPYQWQYAMASLERRIFWCEGATPIRITGWQLLKLT